MRVEILMESSIASGHFTSSLSRSNEIVLVNALKVIVELSWLLHWRPTFGPRVVWRVTVVFLDLFLNQFHRCVR